MVKKTTTIACIQLNSGPEMDDNLEQIEGLLAQAKSNGVELACLPENAALIPRRPDDHGNWGNHDHPLVKMAKTKAKQWQMTILIGSVAVWPGKNANRLVNRCLVINTDGQIANYYDKIHLFDADIGPGEVHRESTIYAPGSRAVIASGPWGKIGLSICYDLRFAHLYTSLAKAGAQSFCVPAAFTCPTGQAHWEVLLRARAIENGCYIMAPAQCGVHHEKRRSWGHSMIIDPWGAIIAEAQNQPTVIIANIDLDKVAHARRRLPVLQAEQAFNLDIDH